MPEGIIIPASLKAAPRRAQFEGLEDYQAAVGGLIEPVRLRDLRATLYVNEEGQLRRLTVNQRATIFWWHWDCTVKSPATLAGDAVLVGRPDADGEITDLPADLTRLILDTDRYRIQVRAGERDWTTGDHTFEDYFQALALADLVASNTAAHHTRIIPA